MSTHPRLFRRTDSTVYYFRAKVPADLVAHYRPRREICFSLHTRDKREAIQKIRFESARLEAEFTALRERDRSGRAAVASHLKPARTHPPARLSDERIQQICGLWTRSVLLTDDDNREQGIIDAEFDELQQTLNETEKDLANALARGRFQVIKPAVNAFLHLLGLEEPENPNDQTRLHHALLKAMLQTVRHQRGRLAGDIVDTDAVAPVDKACPLPETEAAGHFGLMDVYDYWRASVPDRPQRTCQAFLAAMNEFSGYIGHKAASDIQRRDLIAWRDHLRQTGHQAPETIKKKLSAVRAMFQSLVEAEKLPINPAADIKVARAKVEQIKRLPYEPDDMRRIFASPPFIGQNKVPRAAGGAAAVWLPLLGFFTGARLEELAQLHVADVKEEPGLGAYLDINDIEEGRAGATKRLKTTISRRRVPLHPELLRVGFLHYVERCRKAGQMRLFEELKPDRYGVYSGNWSKWWSRYSRKVIGIDSPLKVFHSTRHSFKAACRAAGLSEEVHDALTGHTNGSVGRTYGGRYPLEPLFAAMQKVRYPVVPPVIEPGGMAPIAGRGDPQDLADRLAPVECSPRPFSG